MITRRGNDAIAVSEPPRTIIDKVTNTLYLYVSENLRPNAVAADADWRCYRITVADGSTSWANSSSAFDKQASIASGYTYL